MNLLLFVLEPLLLTNVVLWETIGDSHLMALVWGALAIAMPMLAKWVKG